MLRNLAWWKWQFYAKKSKKIAYNLQISYSKMKIELLRPFNISICLIKIPRFLGLKLIFVKIVNFPLQYLVQNRWTMKNLQKLWKCIKMVLLDESIISIYFRESGDIYILSFTPFKIRIFMDFSETIAFRCTFS